MEEDPGQLTQPWRQAGHTGSFSGLTEAGEWHAPSHSTRLYHFLRKNLTHPHTLTHTHTPTDFCIHVLVSGSMHGWCDRRSLLQGVWLKIKMRSTTILLRSQRDGFFENKKRTLVLVCEHMPTFHLHNIGSHHHSKRQKCAMSQNLQGGRQNITYLVSLSLPRSDNWFVLNQMWKYPNTFSSKLDD